MPGKAHFAEIPWVDICSNRLDTIFPRYSDGTQPHEAAGTTPGAIRQIFRQIHPLVHFRFELKCPERRILLMFQGWISAPIGYTLYFRDILIEHNLTKLLVPLRARSDKYLGRY